MKAITIGDVVNFKRVIEELSKGGDLFPGGEGICRELRLKGLGDTGYCIMTRLNNMWDQQRNGFDPIFAYEEDGVFTPLRKMVVALILALPVEDIFELVENEPSYVENENG